MKKKVFLSVLCLLLSVSMVACVRIERKSDISESEQSLDSAVDSVSVTQAAETANTNDALDEAYKTIECIPADQFAKPVFSFGSGDDGLQISLPSTWRIAPLESGGYELFRGKIRIGSVTIPNATTASDAVTVFSEKNEGWNFNATHTIERYGSDDQPSFRHRFVYDYTDCNSIPRCFQLEVDYKELDSFSCMRAFRVVDLTPTSTDPGIGALKTDFPSILIIGNSFVGSSSVGYILSDMADGRLSVDPVSIGYLTVSRICDDYPTYLNDMSSGYYDMVFLCGFYSSSDATALETVRSACQTSGTQLVIFPAHNESESVINSVKNKYPDVKFLDWKGEIQALINSGVDYDAMCVNDTHKHSTELAGYVGAHMIYRAVLGELPPTSSYGGVNQTYVQQQLGSYLTTGSVQLVPKSDIYILK